MAMPSSAGSRPSGEIDSYRPVIERVVAEHSSGPNRSDRTREVLTVIYFAAGTRVAEPANEHQRVDLRVFLPGVRPGEEARSELNPLLFP